MNWITISNEHQLRLHPEELQVKLKTQIANLLNSRVPSPNISHHSPGCITFLVSFASSIDKNPLAKSNSTSCKLIFFPFYNILDQSSHTHVQPFFHLRVIMSKTRFIMQMRITIIRSCMQRLVKLMISPLIDNFLNRLIDTSSMDIK